MDYLKENITHYCGLEAPGYGLLIIGEWGVGKTFQVKRALGTLDHTYVSLFGLTTPEAIHASVFAGAAPAKHQIKTLLKRVDGLSKYLPSSLRLLGAAPSLLDAFIRQEVKSQQLLVFDDLERCPLSAKEKLGVINFYIEHRDCRVIVLAHDTQLVEEFMSQREKLFGRTIRISPEVGEAFSRFAQEIKPCVTRQFVLAWRSTLLRIFDSSEVRSLRVLRHCIADIGRLFECLKPEHVENTSAMEALVSLIAIFSLESRGHGLVRDDISHGRYAAKEDETEAERPKINVLHDRYSARAVMDMILPDQILISIVFDGHFSQSDISTWLSETPHFRDIRTFSAWRRVIDFDRLEEDIVTEAIPELNSQLENFELCEPGEILHAFSLQFLFVEHGILTGNAESVFESFKNYLKRLSENDTLRIPSDHDGRFLTVHRGYSGIGFYETASSQKYWQEISTLLEKAIGEAKVRSFAPIAESLLRKLREFKVDEFCQSLEHTHDTSAEYSGVPVLSGCNALDFLTAWLSLPVKDQAEVGQVFSSRYRYPDTNAAMTQEIAWARQLDALLLEQIQKTDGISRLRMTRLANYSFARLRDSPVIEEQ